MKLLLHLVFVGALALSAVGCQQEVGSQNTNEPPGGHAEGQHDQAAPGGAAPGGGGHAQ